MTFTEYYTSTFVDSYHPSLPLYTYLYSPISCFDNFTQPLILLLHGAGGDHRQFDAVFPSLIKKGYPVMVCDLRYHGRSQSKDENDLKFDFNVILADLDRALLWFQRQQQKTSPPHGISVILGGLSMGGMIAQLYAQHLMLPTSTLFSGTVTIRALICIGCAHIMINDPSIPWIPFYKTATYDDAQEMIPVARQSIIESAHSALGRIIARSSLCLVNDRILFSCFKACATVPALSHQNHQSFTIPQLLLRGEFDTHTHDVMEAWYTKSKDISPNTTIYNIVPHAGHIATIDNGNLISQYIITFLSSQ